MRENIDYQALKNEINTDPKELGYEGKSPQEIANLMNTIGLSEETVNAGVLEAYKIVNALEANEVAALTSAQRELLNLIISAGQVDASNSKIQAFFLNLFGAGTTTRTNLIAVSIRSASRAEVLSFPSMRSWFIIRAQELEV